MSAARRGRPARRVTHQPSPPRWGWHCLDDRTARLVVARAGVTARDLVVDLGAGTGALTAALVDAGACVVAIELHPDRLDALRARFAGAPVVVVRADVRSVRLPRQAFFVVANPPWSAAEAIRSTLLRSPLLIRADLVVPRKMAYRWAGQSHRIAVGASIRAESFRPPAPAGSAVAILQGRRAATSVRAGGRWG